MFSEFSALILFVSMDFYVENFLLTSVLFVQEELTLLKKMAVKVVFLIVLRQCISSLELTCVKSFRLLLCG